MRILYVTQNYLPEMGAGPGRVSEMAHEWSAAGHDVEILAPVPNHPTGVVPEEYRGVRVFRETDSHGVEVTRTWIYTAANRGLVRRSLAFGSFGLVSIAVGALASRRPDVIIGSSPQLLAAFGGCGIANLRRVPWIFEVRDLWPESIVAVGALPPNSPLLRPLSKMAAVLYRNSSRIVVVTQTFREMLASRGIDSGKIAYVPNGVDLSRFAPRVARPEDRQALGGTARVIVSYMGTHGMAHDLGRLLDVASRMRDRKDVAFAFVGDGAERAELEARARTEKLSNVRFLGVQPRDRMPALYAASDLCVVPLRRTPLFRSVLPSKIFEIMGMAKPIAIAVDGEARRVVEASEAGLFAEPGDTDALERTIRTMVADPDALAKMGERGREFVVREFDRRTLARRYLEVLTAAVASRSNAPSVSPAE